MMIMRGRGERRPRGGASETGRPNPRCGRHRQTGPGWSWRNVPRSLCGYVLAGLAVITLGITWSLGLVGCGPVPSSSYTDATPGAVLPNARQSSQEVSRLLRNAHYYKLMGRPELALKELEQAHRQNPDNLKLINILAQNYEELGQFETARKLYQEALTRNGPNPALTNNLCFTYYLEGRYQEAETCFRQTLALDPNNEAARNNLGLLYCRLGRQDEARRLWQEVEGSAAAEYKTRQALASLGMADRAVYAQRTAPAPAAVAAVSPLPASTPGTLPSPAATLAPQKVAMQVAPQPVPEQPAPDLIKPGPEALPKPAPEQAPPAPAPRATSRSLPPYLTCAELVDTAIEVRNGTPAPHLAREVRSLLSREAFTVVKIGNHVDFGAEKTVIYYRPETQRVAQTLQTDIFPMASLEQSDQFRGKVDIKVLLGHDLLENQDLMARLGDGEAEPTAAAKTPSPTDKRLAAPAAAERPIPDKHDPRALAQEKTAPFQLPASIAQTPGPHSSEPLTAAELEYTAIEVLNGTRTHNLAHRTRTLLSLEGFSVPRIGNYINFGAEKTVIYYRPEAQRVARALGETYFPGAGLESTTKLRKDIAVQILLGADLLERSQVMARLAFEGP